MGLPPYIQAKRLALKRRLSIAFTGRFDPFPPPPAGLALSPSEAHFAALEAPPLALSWRAAGAGDVVAWQEKARAKLVELSGYRRMEGPVRAREANDHALPGGLRRRQCYLAAGPGLDVPVHVVSRPDAAGPLPVMICLHGTNAGIHLAWGGVRMPADPLKIAAGGDYARQAVDRGYLAVCVEQSCFGERTERKLTLGREGPCATAFHHSLLFGRSLVGTRASDVSVVVDWLLAGGAEVEIDPAAIHVMGNSAGGTTAVFAGAMDTRIGGVLASGCTALMGVSIASRPDPEGQNTVPGILNWLEFDDVVALCAPRPFLAIAGRSDHIFPFDQAEEVVSSAAGVYRAHDSADRIRAVPGPGGHRFYPDIAWDAFAALPGTMPAREGDG